jgi:hypothetical protein
MTYVCLKRRIVQLVMSTDAQSRDGCPAILCAYSKIILSWSDGFLVEQYNAETLI